MQKIAFGIQTAAQNETGKNIQGGNLIRKSSISILEHEDIKSQSKSLFLLILLCD